jgi:signal transduction histidine kinase
MNHYFDHSFAYVLGRNAWEGETVGGQQWADRWSRRGSSDPSSREVNLRREERNKERARIARELHDTLFQGFFGASLMLQNIVDQLPTGSAGGNSLSRALGLMRRVLDEGRDTLHELRSPETTESGLEEQLAELGDRLASQETQFRISIMGRPQPLDSTVQEQVFLIVREALLNAFRHSGASSVEAEFEYLPHGLRVVVRDDGVGIDREAISSGRCSERGLLGMRESAKSIAAQLRLWTRSGAGTEIEVFVANQANPTRPSRPC